MPDYVWTAGAPDNSDRGYTPPDNSGTLIASHVYKTMAEVKQAMGQIDNPIIRQKVERFAWRFEDILDQELTRIGGVYYIRSLSLYSEPGQTEITWTFAGSGAGFVFEEDSSSWYCFLNADDRRTTVSGVLNEETCADAIRDVIRCVLR
ncbi:MAG: hypothetical protein LBT41_01165 [Candidatus Methanoplasma sp.]|jgi:hypothetical protein|nr:hypothetical protein [Candidatus Methanoplasma sp.]